MDKRVPTFAGVSNPSTGGDPIGCTFRRRE
jgi:hypothetical protein